MKQTGTVVASEIHPQRPQGARHGACLQVRQIWTSRLQHLLPCLWAPGSLGRVIPPRAQPKLTPQAFSVKHCGPLAHRTADPNLRHQAGALLGTTPQTGPILEDGLLGVVLNSR